MAAQNGQMEVCSTLLKMKADASATDVVSKVLHLNHYFLVIISTVAYVTSPVTVIIT